MRFLYKLKSLILDILFAPQCINCRNNLSEQEKSNKICSNCLDSIPIYNTLFCSQCKARLPNNEKNCHQDSKFLLAAATSYQNDGVKNIIKFLKYRSWYGLDETIKPLIHKYLELLNYDFKDFVILPIPLHRDRLRQRGFNQSNLIAKIFCEKNNLPIITNLKRIKFTKKQAELKDIKERQQNVQNCFSLINPEEIKYKNIVLVDDVFTTGSTINEAVRVLKKYGANKIIAFVFAKT